MYAKLGKLSFVLSALTATTLGAAIRSRSTDSVGAIYCTHLHSSMRITDLFTRSAVISNEPSGNNVLTADINADGSLVRVPSVVGHT